MEAPGAQRLLDAGVFDQEYYEAQAGQDFATPLEAARHYLHHGAADHAPHPLVDLASIPPEARSRIARGHAGKLLAYLRGVGSRRGTGPLFDARLVDHPDADHPGGVLAAWLARGETLLPGRDLELAQARRRMLDAARGTRRPATTGSGARVVVDARADVVAGGVLALEAAASSRVGRLEVLCDGGREQLLHLTARLIDHPHVHLVGDGVLPDGPGDGESLVVVEPGVTARPGWLEPLLARLDDEGVVGVQPLVLDELDLTHPRSGLAATGYPASDAVVPAALEALTAPVRARRPGRGRSVLEPGSVVMLAERARTTPVPHRAPVTVVAGTPHLRWGLRIASPPGARGDDWGDTHFAASLAAALRRRGQDAVVHRQGAHDAPAVGADHVALTIRGLVPVVPAPGAVSVLWVISHPDDVSTPELRVPDLVYAASVPWAERATQRSGRPVLPLLQATDLTGAPDPATPVGTGAEPLFVGVTNPRRPRPIVLDAVAAGVPVAVHGPGWAGRLPAGRLRSSYVPNDELLTLYRRHGLVLADHWADMAAEGFLANRLFDVVASGARAVSDDVAGTEIFEGAVRTYRTPDELAHLCSPAGRREFPDDATMARIADRVAAEHSFDRRAEQLVAGVARILDSAS